MATKRKFKSEALEAIHSSASAIYKVGAIDNDHAEIRCLLSHVATDIEAGTDQEIAAASSYQLNTSESTIEKWETGAKQPSGMALKLLSVVEKHGLAVLS